MRKLATLSALIITSLVLASCGAKKDEKPQDKKITVTNVNISGDGSSYLKVVPGEYTVRIVEDKIVLPIKIEVVKKYQGPGNAEMGDLNLAPLDKSGAAIPDLGLSFMPATTGEWDKIKDLLASDVGKQATVSFKWDYFGDEKKQARIMKEIEGFELTNANITGLAKQTEQTITTTPASNADASSTEGSVAMDKMLDDYEKYADDYITFFKKSKEGDEAAMAEYPEILKSTTKLQMSLAAAQKENKMSMEQIERMMKIQVKMSTAMAELGTK